MLLHILTHLAFITRLWGRYYCYLHFKMRKLRHGLSELLQITWLVSRRIRIWAQAAWPRLPALNHYTIPSPTAVTLQVRTSALPWEYLSMKKTSFCYFLCIQRPSCFWDEGSRADPGPSTGMITSTSLCSTWNVLIQILWCNFSKTYLCWITVVVFCS